jgi:glucan phosphoethanolaminetransferase (alkaline phosphatase superfamily)
MPYEIILFFAEGEEIVDTLKNTIKYMYLSIVLFIISLLFLYLTIYHLSFNIFYYEYSSIILLLLVIVGIFLIGKDKKNKFMPQRYFSSVRNTYNIFALFFVKELPNIFKENTQKYSKYEIKQSTTTTPQTVIIVMGESLSYKRMSLYGYDKSTTPLMDRRKTDENFFFTKGISSATVTKTSVVEFFNIRREPENIEVILNQKTNLFNLAKEQGYKTHYITTQKINIMGNYIGNCDVVLSDKDFDCDGKLYDEVLIDYLDSINFDEKNFIVLHQRNSHSPYEVNIPNKFYKYDYKQKDFHKYMVNSYLNSVLYTDYLYDKLFKKIDNIDKEAIVFITSDHGEMLGFDDEQGSYGHTILDYEVVKVPIMVYKNKLCQIDIDLGAIYNHYQFSKEIATVIGYDINNSNEDSTFYVNGTDIRGKHGFLRYTVRDDFYIENIL